jgi:hypothetical protein
LSNVPTQEDLTPAWFTERLREAGHGSVRVSRVRATQIGTGQLGKCIRFDLELAKADGDVPRSLVGKFPSDDPTSRNSALQLRSYVKEVSFYRELQARLTIGTPRCYYAAIEGDGPEFLLLLEDLAPGVQGDQLAGCSPAVARAAVLQLVGLHAPTWGDASLRDIEWLGEPSGPTVMLGRALYAAQLPGFLERYGPHLEADEAGIIEAVASSKGPPFELIDGPLCLVHVDYRLDNLLIDESVEPPRIHAVDWQSITLGRGLSDVAYFLGAGLDSEVRREVEDGIVRAYHEGLCAAGVAGYSWETCWQDYRRCAFSGFAVTVIASMMVERTERGDEMFVVMARRHSRHALDLGAGEFL